jgi:hypothetical protein
MEILDLKERSQEGGQAEFNLIFRGQSDTAPPPLQTLQRSNPQETESRLSLFAGEFVEA